MHDEKKMYRLMLFNHQIIFCSHTSIIYQGIMPSLKVCKKRKLNPLTVVPESHTGNDHALCDLFRAYFTAIESTKEQPTI